MRPSIVILTGAGISAESGIDTFRDPSGIWSRYRIEDVATPDAFRRDPGRVHDFYNMRRAKLLADDIRPNAAHEALARLDGGWDGEFLLVTQNIDDLHERAGSKRLIHMHGEQLKSRCQACLAVTPLRGDLSVEHVCAACGTKGNLRPHVVWFGEMPLDMDRITAALSQADLFVAIGTSGNVYPAADFVSIATEAGARTVELNLEATRGSGLFDKSVQGPATDIVPRFVGGLLRDGL
ncbi:MAG TPA: NAD-dependent deacylase [Stellaceae bacterium]|nr:NAD-dependent deacylase [Stellaceae bacterium]